MAAAATRVRAAGDPVGTAGGPADGAPGGAAGGAAGAVVPRPAPGRGALGPVRLQQLVLLEVAAALVLVAWVVDRLLVAPAAVVAALLVVLAVLRPGRRPVTEWLASRQALRRRAVRAAAEPPAPGTDPRLAPAVECEPALRTVSFDVPAPLAGPGSDDELRSVGLVGDGTFLTAVIRVDAVDRPLRPGRGERALPLGLLRDALDVDGIRLESAQVVQSTLPAPAPHLSGQGLAARNYAPLHAVTASPAVRQTWVALKFDPELCPEAVEARGGGVRGARRCVLRVADQVASRLRGAGFRAVLLTEDELTAALATAACLNPAATEQAGRTGAPARRTAETARAWRCDDRWHTTYWVSRWPRLGTGTGAGGGAVALPELAALLTTLPALSTTLSLTLGRGRTVAGRHAPTLTGHIRICGRSADEVHELGRALERAARGAKAGLTRLDHDQVPGVLATLPLGGTR
ncbi:type VII secretion protein EccE [Streptomyces mashuensis]|uniref:Type VII secretion protein EccE n=1 Tax=Streptomyces mashuensis TaxID=33904 RepID=A0A919BB45_9ACTN|nr:type VII secretion protein EccE [Streptomyces mashuensis]GHF74788.1 type VII secretion protein EccE [Streptomyces mashuensis]